MLLGLQRTFIYFIHKQLLTSSFLYVFAGEGILPYLPTLMEKLLLALSPSTVSS